MSLQLKEGLRCILRADGRIEKLDKPMDMEAIEKAIDGRGLDVVNLRACGLVMIVDDMGHIRKLPRNEAATRLYHSVCIPGTTHWIAGDAVIVPDQDYDDE